MTSGSQEVRGHTDYLPTRGTEKLNDMPGAPHQEEYAYSAHSLTFSPLHQSHQTEGKMRATIS